MKLDLPISGFVLGWCGMDLIKILVLKVPVIPLVAPILAMGLSIYVIIKYFIENYK